jgi:hypothetical protein
MAKQVPVWRAIFYKEGTIRYLSSKAAGAHGNRPGIRLKKSSKLPCQNLVILKWSQIPAGLIQRLYWATNPAPAGCTASMNVFFNAMRYRSNIPIFQYSIIPILSEAN